MDNIYSILRAYQNKEPSRFQKTTINAFDLIFENKQYYIDGSGNVLVRANKIWITRKYAFGVQLMSIIKRIENKAKKA